MEEELIVRSIRYHHSTDSEDQTSFNENCQPSSVNKETMLQL
jgi:hypothetical protein